VNPHILHGTEFDIGLTLEQARSASHQGQCGSDVEALSKVPEVAAQLAAIDPAALRRCLREYGTWDAGELADHEQNLQRILWLAAGDIMDNPPADWLDCGCCSGCHPPDFYGDCRDDANRWP
jgi:hypothetical protein